MKKATFYLTALVFIAIAFVTISFASFNINLYVNGSWGGDGSGGGVPNGWGFGGADGSGIAIIKSR